jgi:trans-aconitate 2-methyltransferase
MAATTWNPAVYLDCGDERLRPAVDLLAHVPLEAPQRIVDLGCGPGNATRLLSERWPGAEILGVDSSPAMLAQARASGLSVKWLEADLAEWRPERPFDLIYANAVLHWLDHHDVLFPRLMSDLRPGGALAVQMPRNFAAPSHRLLRSTAEDGPWASCLRGVLREEPVAPQAFYFELLNARSQSVDIWETDYLHVLRGDDPVLAWTRGTALRPVMDALDEEAFRALEAAYAARLRQAYPRRADGTTLFGFRRLFIVARA